MSDKWLTIADRINALRIFPRVFLTIFFCCYVWLFYESWIWYTGLDFKDLGVGNLAVVTAFPVALLSALGGMFTSMYKAYQAFDPKGSNGDA